MALNVEQGAGVAGGPGGPAGVPSAGGATPQPLVVSGLQVFYGPARALTGVDISVEAGGALGLIGNNGAGKTTLMRTLAGLHYKRWTSGTATYGGTSLLGKKGDQVARMGVGLVRDGGRVFENMTIRDHLNLAAKLGRHRGGQAGDVDQVLATFPLLQSRGANTKAGLLSGGQRQVVCLAMAAVSGATCILLDEPSAGLAESTTEQVFGIIGDLAKTGVTMLIAEQDVRWLPALTNRVAHLEMGRIIGYEDL